MCSTTARPPLACIRVQTSRPSNRCDLLRSSMNSRFTVIVALACALWSPVRAAGPGSAAPICVLKSLDEESPINMGQFKGKVVYVDFWASWCAPCARSFPFLNDLDREFRDRGLIVLAINLDEKLE